MDADATSSLHKKGVAVTNDSFKFIWFEVSLHSVFSPLFNHYGLIFLKIWCMFIFNIFSMAGPQEFN